MATRMLKNVRKVGLGLVVVGGATGVALYGNDKKFNVWTDRRDWRSCIYQLKCSFQQFASWKVRAVESQGSSCGSGDKNKDSHFKVFQDPSYGNIKIHPLLVKIIDTPQFQRLRYISQLGATYFVYPSACHSRFEHSIGTSHLAGSLLRKIKENQQNLQIDDKDILCVEIAGLCHDLGHGPFSHVFDGKFMPQSDAEKIQEHEEVSVAMFKHLLESNEHVKREFEKNGLQKRHIEFIEDLILGTRKTAKYYKRKEFLYQIISNKCNGIDVDKWDYLSRDCLHIGKKSAFDYLRSMNFVRMLPVEKGNAQSEVDMCFRDKEIENLYGMFHMRRNLHVSVCHHKVVDAIEIMITDAFLEADKYLFLYNSKGEQFKLSECQSDCEAFTTLTDNVFQTILHSRDKQLSKARIILERIMTRDLYKCAGEARLYVQKGQEIAKEKKKKKKNKEGKLTQIDVWKTQLVEMSNGIPKDKLHLEFVKFDYGMNIENPLRNTPVYTKHLERRTIDVDREVSSMLPTVFCEYKLVLYCKEKEYIEEAARCFKKWCEENKNIVTLV